MTPEWIDVSIHSAVDSGELLGLLGDPHVRGAWEDQGVTHLYWARDHWSGDQLGQVRAALDQLDPSGQSSGTIHVGDLPHQDWNRQWAQSVKPIRVGRRLVIRPSWETASLLSGDLDIILDPKQAFGTGHHATTRMLLEWLEELIHGGETVLDVGSGSGILAMAALRLGARSAVGCRRRNRSCGGGLCSGVCKPKCVRCRAGTCLRDAVRRGRGDEAGSGGREHRSADALAAGR